MKLLTILALSLLLASCGATVAVDYEEQTDWSPYTQYQFYPNIDSGLSELDNKRIIMAVDSAFGFTRYTKSANPQFLINFYAEEALSNSRNTIGLGLGGGGGNVGVGGSVGIPIGGPVIEQQITIDFIDSEKDQLIWQAVVDCKLKERATPEQKDAHYVNVIMKALKKFPPKK
ncbi:DUF4136 domain-containing protein [Aureisphaera galaxeae]|uniref:DUF4136 domain-containing protein n=1 Tax=Aureisphaera galaxeae TaxID=1538023 RepID=UPI00234FE188|nr:DUF4136 domain-containing protein [Aureisphaera galaxeae]MDC8005609.1 DUF4136 domain-containing protein [Aureisphaera galaxeae]